MSKFLISDPSIINTEQSRRAEKLLATTLSLPRTSAQAIEQFYMEARRRLENLRQEMIQKIKNELWAAGDRTAARIRQTIGQAQTR
ncbi:hypothetical protein Ngar_c05170 [Candidatus Nitrososphaera gargensis Ga9.2]|uniref:Uncharacterized protein n=1 Tax=Nitrososphaera gargensis (strain Ga9.2) TaxID=1237085 RepID=K0ICS9_NITGG|nr:hypothetical protein Ngar_c05170 [Candidatus Nitrososphaera gargensis Ga9.2]